jgi:hypothetical protein
MFEEIDLSDKIAIIASVVALLQFLALVATVYMMIRTARRQLRAYVLVSGSAVANVVEGDGIPEAQVVIENFGQTPAFNFVNVTGFAGYAYPPPKSITLTVPKSRPDGIEPLASLGKAGRSGATTGSFALASSSICSPDWIQGSH